MKNKYTYIGDVNLAYGGTFFDMSTFDKGYVDAVRVTDLDSAIGFNGAILIEHVTILGMSETERENSALECVGLTRDDLAQMKPSARKIALADALMCYGYFDPDDSWDNYHSAYRETIQTEPKGAMAFDGWEADKRMTNGLRAYIRHEHLR